ncbi:FAD-binding and (Fe-S)-binding domain-containing protein [Pontimicrobium sp. IMCC45349]|uniref:FAD-binding and (Fe-S)-binding domain-containing protein n=1 Tax=Pontimicrobium sp. IMCC45349 TaxID=3391574 RepID=UPI0039A2D473
MNNKLEALKSRLKGDLHYSNLVKALYATDASVYRELPLAVALPKSTKDIKLLIEFAQVNKVSIIPRAAGTSLAGQCVGNGIVVDVSKYLNEVLEINTQEQWVRVQPGVVRDELNAFLKPYGFFFGPNTSTANRCNIGGMVGNNSCGSTSIVYGATRDHVLELKTVLSDGSEVTFADLLPEDFQIKKQSNTLEGAIYRHIAKELSNKDVIENVKKHFPKVSITRRNTGYAVDTLLATEVFSESQKQFNFSKLLAGSEGTLAFTTEIKLNIVPLPKPVDVVLNVHFKSINDSLKATVIAMKHQPTACELMDKTILDCTKDNISQEKNRYFVEGDPEAILMIEFREDSLEAAEKKAKTLINDLKHKQLGYAFPIVSGDKTNNVWELRKAGLGLLANIPGDKKAVACIEDTAVDVEDLPEYIEEFTNLMKGFKQKAVYYAHAGAGELHLRPILDLKSKEDVKLFRDISKASAELVKKYRGSLSGEHGDGRVRAEFIPLVLGDDNYQLFKRIKKTWDENNIFNPGKIVDAQPMDHNLRYEADVEIPDIKTVFNFSEKGGLLRTVEKCNGSGDCRKLNFAGGTMCPSYRATLNEKDTTRGRANVLREFLTQNTKENPFNHPEIKEALDLCLSCKGCKSECPSNVDMATLKSEFLYQYHKSNPVSLRSKLIANNARLNLLASKFPLLHNTLIKQSWFKSALGIAKQRSLPELKSKTFKQWFKSHRQKETTNKVYLFVDEYTNYYDVEIGIKAIKLLNSLGYFVKVVNHQESGRAFISKGFLDKAKVIASKNVNEFKDLITSSTPLIGIEPSAILSFRDEYPNLVDESLVSNANKLKDNVFLIEEFLSREIDKGNINPTVFSNDATKIKYHGHCHQKAMSSQEHVVKILSLPKNYSVELINSGCCGMAGSFGYEEEHYQLSNTIAEMKLLPEVRNANSSTIIAASGTSCRHQIKDGANKKSVHPIEVLYDALIIKE